jgi:hypothetical protein
MRSTDMHVTLGSVRHAGTGDTWRTLVRIAATATSASRRAPDQRHAAPPTAPEGCHRRNTSAPAALPAPKHAVLDTRAVVSADRRMHGGNEPRESRPPASPSNDRRWRARRPLSPGCAPSPSSPARSCSGRGRAAHVLVLNEYRLSSKAKASYALLAPARCPSTRSDERPQPRRLRAPRLPRSRRHPAPGRARRRGACGAIPSPSDRQRPKRLERPAGYFEPTDRSGLRLAARTGARPATSMQAAGASFRRGT